MTKTIEISDESYEKIKDQLLADELIDISTLDELVGQKLFIRTVTYHMTGKVVKRLGTFIQLETAAWVADSGRFSNALKTGELSEVEPVGTMWVNLDSVVDFFLWKHKLPTIQK
jgi:hypothetical protein